MKINKINNKCKTCKGECKQLEQVKVVYCPNYKNIGIKNSFKDVCHTAEVGTLQAQENAPEPRG